MRIKRGKDLLSLLKLDLAATVSPQQTKPRMKWVFAKTNWTGPVYQILSLSVEITKALDWTTDI